MRKSIKYRGLIFFLALILCRCISSNSAVLDSDGVVVDARVPTSEDAWSLVQNSEAVEKKKYTQESRVSSVPLEDKTQKTTNVSISVAGFDEAEHAIKRGYNNLAEMFYFRRMADNEKDLDALLGMAHIEILRGEYEGARDYLEVAVAVLGDGFDFGESHRARLALLQAKVQMAIGENQLGRIALINLSAKFPQMEDIYLALAECYFDEDLPQLALDVIFKGINEIGDRESFSIYRLRALIALGDLLDADLLLNQLLSDRVSSGEAFALVEMDAAMYWHVVRALLTLHRIDEAAIMIAEGEKRFPSTYERHLVKAYFYEKEGYFSEMEGELQRALKTNHQAIEARLLLAKLYYNLLARRSDSLRLAQEARLFSLNRPKYLKISDSFLKRSSPSKP